MSGITRLMDRIRGKRSRPPASSNPSTPLTAPATPFSKRDMSITDTEMSKKSRRIFVNVDPKDSRGRTVHQSFCSNRIQTTKYTFFTFLPKNLFEQFRSVANFYFTSLVILQLFPPFDQVSFGLTATPVIIIIVATAIKDAVEDYRRLKADQSVNSSKTYVLKSPTAIDDAEEIQQSFLSKLGLAIIAVLINWVLIPLRIMGKDSKTDDQLDVDPPILMPSDYLFHEKPKRLSSVVRPSTSAPPGSGAYWKKKNWENVKVGDFVLLRSNHSIPADIVILSTSEPDGICYVETKNLDGETNLKIRKGVPEFAHLTTPDDCVDMKAYIDVEAPNELMYNFNATVRANPSDPSAPRLSVAGRRMSVDRRASFTSGSTEKLIPVTINGVLLRGCVIRNTDWVIGIVVYTGEDTKLMRNAGGTPSKRSKIERQMNPQILLNFAILFAMCMICGVLGAAYQYAFNSSVPNSVGGVFFAVTGESQSGREAHPAYQSMIIFFLCMIIFQSIIPIALYLSIDICKTIQSFLIHLDDDLVDDGLRCVPRTWNLCDDLGQIEYIFSDKTGTLTCNVMEFRKCSINGVIYGRSYVDGVSMLGSTSPTSPSSPDVIDETASPDAAPLTKRQLDERNMRKQMKALFDPKYVSPDPLSFVDPDLHRHVKRGGDQAVAIKQFFALLAVCHTVLAEKYEDDEYAIMYKAQSPDEKALVEAARDNGFAFLRRESNTAIVDIFGEEQQFTVHHVIEFNSDRKRMSVILKPPPDMNLPEGDMLLLCKGADSIIFERLSSESGHDLKNITKTHLELFANDGLRTLCLAYRIIPKDVYEDWAQRFMMASSLIVDREKEMDRVAGEIERDMLLMGATAIEDKLQTGVPDTIALLARAGIKIWVLTGDKMETAINIGFSCNLLKKNMTLIIIKAISPEDTQQQLHDALERFWDEHGQPKDDRKFALIIDGDSLTFVFDERNDKKKKRQGTLLELACRCTAVVCCRVSPLQKAQVVALVRKGLGAMCLAIGDGANDVSMIQEADVGIGISGKEGLQAVMASDYAIAQFRFLSKLLLVHGRWAYVRISEMILLYFYKNVVWLFVLFWFQFDSAVTGDTVTEFTYGMFFNTIFTLLPNLLVGVFDQDVNAEMSIKYPGIYGKGIRQELYTMERFWLYIFDAIYQSVIAYYISAGVYGEGVVDQRGYSSDRQSMGTVIALIAIITINLYMGLNNFSWTWMTHLAVYVEILVFVAYVLGFAADKTSPTFGQTMVLFSEPQLYFTVVFGIVLSLLPRIFFKAVQQYIMPTDTDLVQEIQKWNIQAPEEERTTIGDDMDSLMSSSTTQDLTASFKQMKNQMQASAIQESPERTSISTDNILPEKSHGTPTSAEKVVLKSRSDSNLDSARTPLPYTPGKDEPLTVNVHGIETAEVKVEPPPSTLRRTLSGHERFQSTLERMRRSIMGSIEGKNDDKGLSPQTPSRSRRNSQSPTAGIGGLFLQPLALMGRNVGDFVKNMPKKLRIGSMGTISKLEKTIKSPSLIFMATHQELSNTGFCFSQEEGMGDVITPMRTSTNPELDFAYMPPTPVPLTAPPVLHHEDPEPSPSGSGEGPSSSATQRAATMKSILSKDSSFAVMKRPSRRASRVTFQLPTHGSNGDVIEASLDSLDGAKSSEMLQKVASFDQEEGLTKSSASKSQEEEKPEEQVVETSAEQDALREDVPQDASSSPDPPSQ